MFTEYPGISDGMKQTTHRILSVVLRRRDIFALYLYYEGL
jgi:hypothetical protein